MSATATPMREFSKKRSDFTQSIPWKNEFANATGKPAGFAAEDFFRAAEVAKAIRKIEPKETIFSQGDACNNVMYIQEGEVKLSAVSYTGKEAIVAILKAGDFVGEGALAGQLVRGETATALTAATLFVIDRKEMTHALHAEPEFLDHFISYVLERNTRFKKDLIDQLFNGSEKRLARILVLLASQGNLEKPKWAPLHISQEMLAGMVGTTRSRVNFFMNKFKKLGFIQYHGGLQVNDSLLSVVLDEG
jgi:CRP/FNR family cyclic AMP-dependent transcriptional regulator